MARPTRLRAAALVGAAAALSLALSACPSGKRSGDGDGRGAASSSSTSFVPPKPVERPRGGVARVGVWGMPDPNAPTLAGAAVRSLVLPQLFTVAPDGTRLASLVQPGSDQSGPEDRSASFLLRPGAVWSNGAPITVEDLRRSADAAFVEGVDGPAPDGRITVRFRAPMPGWRRLWSDSFSVAPPGPGVWGGPFVVASVTAGLETVLKPNPSWWGKPGPFLDEVRLVLVPDSIMQRQLFERGELDVLSPPAATNRIGQLGGVAPSGPVKDGGLGGWDVRLVANPARVDERTHAALAASTNRHDVVGTLLRGEAAAEGGSAADGDRSSSALGALKGKTVQVSTQFEEPMSWVLQRAMHQRARSAEGSIEFRNAEADVVEGWVAAGDFDAALVMGYEPPEGCLKCREGVTVTQVWRSRVVVAARGVEGVDPNPWALTPAWDASEWWRSGGTS